MQQKGECELVSGDGLQCATAGVQPPSVQHMITLVASQLSKSNVSLHHPPPPCKFSIRSKMTLGEYNTAFGRGKSAYGGP